MYESTSNKSLMNTEDKSEAALEHLKQVGKLRIADEAVMMADKQHLLAYDRAKVRAHDLRFLGDIEEEDMGNIHIGDVNQTTPSTLAPSASGSLSRKAIAAGLLALGGGGIGAGGMALYEFLADTQPPPAAESFEDTDTEYEMKLVPDGA